MERTGPTRATCDPAIIDALTRLSRDACLVMDPGATILSANEEATRLYGYARDEFVGMRAEQLCTTDSAHSLAEELARSVREGLLVTSTHVRKDGTTFPVEVAWKRDTTACGELLVAHVRDIRERLDLEHEILLKSEIFDAALDAIIVHDLEGNLVQANRTAALAAGLSPEEFLSLGPWGWIPARARASTRERAERLAEKGALFFEGRAGHADGSTYPVEVHARIVRLGERTLVVSVIRDISERAETLEQMRKMAFSDPLTGLANRAELMKALGLAIAEARRHGDTLGLIFLDLDAFKPVNDRLGHAAGDQVLVDLARRLEATVRVTDTVARMGGDEFAIVLPRLADAHAITEAGHKIAAAVNAPATIDGEEVSVSASIGAAIFDPDADDADSLLAKADSAMYAAKRSDMVWRLAGDE